MIGLREKGEHLGLTGYLKDAIVNAKGSTTPGLSVVLAKMYYRAWPSGMHRPWAVIQQETKLSELYLVQGGTASPIPFFLATFLDYTSTWNFG